MPPSCLPCVQLDKLRTIIESMLSSSSTLSLSITPHKSTSALAPGQLDPETTCPACSLDVGHQVNLLVQRYEELQDMVSSLAASRPSKKAKLQNQVSLCSAPSQAGCRWPSGEGYLPRGPQKPLREPEGQAPTLEPFSQIPHKVGSYPAHREDSSRAGFGESRIQGGWWTKGETVPVTEHRDTGTAPGHSSRHLPVFPALSRLPQEGKLAAGVGVTTRSWFLLLDSGFQMESRLLPTLHLSGTVGQRSTSKLQSPL